MTTEHSSSHFTFAGAETKKLEVRLERASVTAEPTTEELGWVRVESTCGASDGMRLEVAGSSVRFFQTDGRYRDARVAIGVPARSLDFSVEIHLGIGDINVSDLECSVSARTGAGSVDLHRCQGSVEVRTGAGDLSITGCQGELDIHTGAGDVRLAESSLHGRCQTGRGDVRLERVDGSLRVKTGVGEIRGLDLIGESLHLQTGMGEISLAAGSLQQLTVISGAGDLACSRLQVAGRLELQTGRGKIGVESSHAGELRVRSGAGDLGYSGTFAGGDHQMDTGMGSVQVQIPAAACLRVEAITRMGSVHSEFPLVKVGRPGPQVETGARFVGTTCEGGALGSLQIKTGAGSIHLQRFAVSPARNDAEETASRPTLFYPTPSGPAAPAAASNTGLDSNQAPSAAEEIQESPAEAGDPTRLSILRSLERSEITVEQALELLQGVD